MYAKERARSDLIILCRKLMRRRSKVRDANARSTPVPDIPQRNGGWLLEEIGAKSKALLVTFPTCPHSHDCHISVDHSPLLFRVVWVCSFHILVEDFNVQRPSKSMFLIFPSSWTFMSVGTWNVKWNSCHVSDVTYFRHVVKIRHDG